jgi:hypothetical protein
MRDSYPVVLVLFIRVGWRHSSFCGKRKLGNSISQHLFRVGTSEIVLYRFYSLLNGGHRMSRATDRSRIEHMDTFILTS